MPKASKPRLLKCTVPYCQTQMHSGFSSLPKDSHFRKIWVDKLQLESNIKTHRVCHNHFHPSDFGRGNAQIQLLKNRVPSKNLPVRLSITISHWSKKPQSIHKFTF